MLDPGLFACDENPNHGCRNSDATLGHYASYAAYDLGHIARPASRNSGTLTLDANTPRLEIVGQFNWAVDGEVMEKGGPGHFLVRKITPAVTFRSQKRLLCISTNLTDQHIGLEERTTVSGPSSSTLFCSLSWTSGTISSVDDKVLPMLPVYFVTHVPGRSIRA